MTSRVKQGNRIPRARRRMAIAGLALAALWSGIMVASSAQAQTYNVLYNFTGGTDGGYPIAGLIRDAAGNLFGTTAAGGTSGNGTVFKVDNTGTETVLYSFSGSPDGSYPGAGLIRDRAGNLYGTTIDGGLFTPLSCFGGCGSVFKVDTTGAETILHSFTGGVDGAEPAAGLLRDAAGNLYSTTSLGGTFNAGTVFKIDGTGRETVLHSFKGGADGSEPFGSLVVGSAGKVYGTTYKGGDVACRTRGCGHGTVSQLDATGTETVLYSFAGTPDGEYPYAGLVRDAAGNLYGTTEYGGRSGAGTVFKLDNSGKETVLYSFTGGTDGSGVLGGVIRDAAGNLYGTTLYGGDFDRGTIFKLDTTGTKTILHSFTEADGAYPFAALIRDTAGNLYGTTETGGVYEHGVVFVLNHSR
ncbi:MAG TPA: choice-of-anchor tandem repeat GloVer-containing protein [Terriglobales bacterium]|jgi:uncharacterized repeat protein (TIGR03803 family)|nr:choice-of-anchor tandem repeat GloVer-containing protein [Terriglobales bacterium]